MLKKKVIQVKNFLVLKIRSLLKNKTPLGLAILGLIAAFALISGTGIAVAITGTPFFSEAERTQQSSVPEPKNTAINEPKSIQSQNPSTNEGSDDQISNSEITLDTDPGEDASYQGGQYGVRVYFLPDGIRIAAVFYCVRNSNMAVQISGVYPSSPSNHNLCTGVTGSRQGGQGVSFFYPAYACHLSPVVTVTLDGTNIDGTRTYAVPQSLRPPCGVTPIEPSAPTEPQPPSPDPVPQPDPSPTSDPVTSPSPS